MLMNGKSCLIPLLAPINPNRDQLFCLVSTASGQHFSHSGQLLVSIWFGKRSAVLQFSVQEKGFHMYFGRFLVFGNFEDRFLS